LWTKASQCKVHQKGAKNLMLRSSIQKVAAFRVTIWIYLNGSIKKIRKSVKNLPQSSNKASQLAVRSNATNQLKHNQHSRLITNIKYIKKVLNRDYSCNS
jgi:hypothetical protein